MLFRSFAALALATLTIAPAIAAVDDALPGNRLQPPRAVGAAQDVIVVAQNQSVADLIARVQRLEGQNRQLTGRVDELTNALRLLQQELAKSREDMEYRLQALEGGAPAPTKRSDAVKTPAADTAATPSIDPGLAGVDLGAPAADLGTIPVDPALAGGALQDDTATAAAEASQPLDLTALPRVDGEGDAAGGVKSGLTPPGLPGVAIDTSQPIIAAAPTSLPKDEFDLAYGFLQRKDYGIAEASFRKFLIDHPDDALIPDAVHWLGESLFQRKQYRDAAEQFLKVTSDYSKSRRAPSSMLRLAMSLSQLGEKETACDTLKEVGRRYPSASDTVKNAVKRELGKNQC
jgi:tol-pal system protein YbgF